MYDLNSFLALVPPWLEAFAHSNLSRVACLNRVVVMRCTLCIATAIAVLNLNVAESARV